jgi:hypothetical protein
MKLKLLQNLVPVVAFMLVGCGEKTGSEPELAVPSPTAAVEITSQPVAAATESAPETTAPVLPPADLTAAARPLKEDGSQMTDLEVLTSLVRRHNESLGSQEVDTTGLTFKTEAEEMAYREARAVKGQPITEVSQLVTLGLLKLLPPPPAGKRYAINPETQEVVLAVAN